MDKKEEWDDVEEQQESEETYGQDESLEDEDSEETHEDEDVEEPYEGQDPKEPEHYTEETAEVQEAELVAETHADGRRINWLAIAAIALGAFGLFIGYSAKRSVKALRTETEQVTSSKGRLAYLEDQVKSIEGRLVNVGAETVQNKNQIRGVRLDLHQLPHCRPA